MVPQTSNMVDVVIRSVRIYKVQKSGDLHEKLAKDVNLLCEYSPQGVSIKVLAGMWRFLSDESMAPGPKWLSQFGAHFFFYSQHEFSRSAADSVSFFFCCCLGRPECE